LQLLLVVNVPKLLQYDIDSKGNIIETLLAPLH